MNDGMTAAPAAKVPATYWVIAILSLVWNAFGGVDYVMTRTRNMDWLAQAGDPQVLLRWIDSFPLWAQVAWPVGVWASVLGSVLLLARSRHAATAFLVSLAGAVISFAYQFSTPAPAELDTTMNKVMPIVILAIIAALWLYAKRSGEKGWLK